MSDPSLKAEFHPKLHRFAVVTVCCTLLLLLAGALVTSTGSSLAVPDWPLSFGTLFPKMQGGVIFEHGHRLIAGTVATMMLGLALVLQKVERRPWVKALGWTALGAVVCQAVLGGVTVLLHLPTQVSVAHAGLAQVFFCLVTSLALFTSKSWIEERPRRLQAPGLSLPLWTLLATLLIYIQILVGAVTRHSGWGLAITHFPLFDNDGLWPDGWTSAMALQFSHTRVGAFLVLVLVTGLSYRVCTLFPEERGLFWPAAAAGLLVWVQCFIGMLVLFTGKAIVPTSLHVLVGGALLASMLVLSLKSHQLFRKGTP
jgi:heme a synthase